MRSGSVVRHLDSVRRAPSTRLLELTLALAARLALAADDVTPQPGVRGAADRVAFAKAALQLGVRKPVTVAVGQCIDVQVVVGVSVYAAAAVFLRNVFDVGHPWHIQPELGVDQCLQRTDS